MDQDMTAIDIQNILNADVSFESKMLNLLCMEHQIEQEYAMGLTRVKPISLLEPEDLI